MRFSKTIAECKSFLLNNCHITQRPDGKFYGINHTPNQYNRKHYVEFRESIEARTPDCRSDAERWFCILNDLTEVPKCFCGQKCKFQRFKVGYSSGCCSKHSHIQTRRDAGKLISQTIDQTYEETQLSRAEVIKFIKSKSRLFFTSEFTIVKHIEIVKAIVHYTNFIPKRKKPIKRISEGAFCLVNDINEVPKCVVCSKAVNYSGGKYHECCSRKCVTKNPNWVEKKKKTNLERYGVTAAYNSKENKFKEKIRRSKPGYWKIVSEKAKLTCIERYGVDSSMKVPKFKDKLRKSILNKYGVETFGGATVSLKHPNFDIMYQGSFEKLFIDYWISNKNKNIKRGPRITYLWNSIPHDYFIDFIVEDVDEGEHGLRLIEVKGSHRWFFEELKNGKLEAKLTAAYVYSQNGYLEPLLMLNGKPFTYIESLELFKTLKLCQTDREILETILAHENPTLYDIQRGRQITPATELV